jgi:hypothetical protein
VCGIGILESMLEPHLKKAAGATQMEVGVAFLLLGGLFMMANPIAGWVTVSISKLISLLAF